MFVANENVPMNKVSNKTTKKVKSIEETYTKMTQLEHILLRPDTYIGSIEKQSQPMWVLDSLRKKIVMRPVTYVPGLFKIFDEIMVNAADNKQRDPTMNRINVDIDPVANSIRVWNNGNGIPIAIHKDHGIYVPELIFGNLLTGSNFDDKEEKTTGGRNGYGAKLANIFSKRFIIETADSSRSLKYVQEFRENMGQKGEPKITPFTGTDYTCITFYPDLSRFKMEQDGLDEDILALLSKRVYDIAATGCNTGAKMKVYLNNERIDISKFENYLEMYEGIEPPIYFERISDRWEAGVGVSEGSFQHVSFVNSISTTKGGGHVNYITDQILQKLAPIIKKKNKGEDVKPNQMKNHLCIFVNALITNPAFDSQTKENMTTKASSFGSTCTIPDKMIKAIEKSPIIDNILNWSKMKQTQELKKKSGSKHSKVLGITKLDDANFAGTSKSAQCTLILTEGDSAKALAVSGMGVVGRDYYGAFPLKGKLLNVREATHAQIMKNEEIQNITKILGLTFGKVYEDVSSLRYGHLMIMTDQDHDGSHIKGLLINFLHHFWPSLLKIPGFLQQFITPIVKCSKKNGKKELSFYTIPEYKTWKESHADGRGWKIKYYKGLGTSTGAEAKEYFSNLQTHEIDFAWDEQANDVIEMAFSKKRVDDRKLWLLAMENGTYIDYTARYVTYDAFVNRELILFSHADNERSIAHFMDGMKPSQRKVLFACFKRNLKNEIKVAQLAGYVSEHSAYHHGEASLTQTIIGMAQNFVGSNNINLLSPCGQFGTRLMGGKDAASPRYVFTKLEPITRAIFHIDDDPLLEYLEDDGTSIEPVYYVPIIPMGLVNGSEGIGTGWSSSIPTYNPREIIANIKKMIHGEEPDEMLPWYRGFTGTVQRKTASSFTITGTIDVFDEQTVRISELPVGKWTTDYKQYLESVLLGNTTSSASASAAANDGTAAVAATAPFIKDFKENHTDATVLFTVQCPAEKLAELSNAGANGSMLIKRFKLDASVSTTNMNMFDLNSQIKKYDGPLTLLKDFFHIRMTYYDQRKIYLLKKFTNEWDKLDNKVKFLLAVIKGEIVVANRKKVELLNDMKNYGLKAFANNDESNGSKANKENDEAAADEAAEEDDEEEGDGKATKTSSSSTSSSLEHGYDYLLSLKLWNLTMEKVKELTQQRDLKRQELDQLRATSPERLWLNDLDHLEQVLDDFEAAIDEAKAQEMMAQKKAAKKGTAKQAAATGGGGGKKKAFASYDSGDEDEVDEGYESDYGAAKKSKPKVATKKEVKVASKPTAAVAAKPTVVATTTATAAAVQSMMSDFLKANKPPASTAATAAAPQPAAKPALATKKVAAPVAAPKAKKASATTVNLADSEDEEDDDDHEQPVVIMEKRASRAAAQAKKTYVVDLASDDEEEEADFDDEEEGAKPVKKPASTTQRARKPTRYDESDDEEEDDFEESFIDDDDEDFNMDVETPVKKPKAAATKKAATVPAVAATKATTAKPAAANAKATSSLAAPVVAEKEKGKKRMKRQNKVNKGSDEDEDDDLFNSPIKTPKPAKKSRTLAKQASPVLMKMLAMDDNKNQGGDKKKATTTTTTAAPKATTKAATAVPKEKKVPAPKKGKAVAAESDDEEDDMLVDSPITKRSPKPTRAARPTANFKKYYDEDEEEEEESFNGDDESDFDD